ncbi:MAG: 4Fe-4S binding protein [Hydrogenoanaerobacterium sp.]
MNSIIPEEIKRLKGMGFLLNRGTNNFSMRVITENGVLTAQQLICLSEASKKFGNGKLAFTTRMTIELIGIPYEKAEEAQKYINREGLRSGGTGAKIRPVVACKGTTCVFGKIDTQEMAKEIHKKFFEGWSDISLPHKFKIAVGGCPNNCTKPDLNDFGIVGALRPCFNEADCKGCKSCAVQKVCPINAVQRDKNGKIHINSTLCTQCGRCVTACPFKLIPNGENGMKIYIGGRWGKNIRRGTLLEGFFTTKDEVYEMLTKTLLFFRDQGIKGKRLGETLDRIGIPVAAALLYGDELLKRKDEILSAPLKEKE